MAALDRDSCCAVPGLAGDRLHDLLPVGARWTGTAMDRCDYHGDLFIDAVFHLSHRRLRIGAQTAEDAVAHSDCRVSLRGGQHHLQYSGPRPSIHRLDTDRPHDRLGNSRGRLYLQRTVPARPAAVFRSAVYRGTLSIHGAAAAVAD